MGLFFTSIYIEGSREKRHLKRPKKRPEYGLFRRPDQEFQNFRKFNTKNDEGGK